MEKGGRSTLILEKFGIKMPRRPKKRSENEVRVRPKHVRSSGVGFGGKKMSHREKDEYEDADERPCSCREPPSDRSGRDTATLTRQTFVDG